MPFISRAASVVFSASLFFFTLSLFPDVSNAGRFGFGAEAGAGVKHNDDGAGLILRGLYLGESDAGCGILIGTWGGDYENDVAGLTCEKRWHSKNSGRRTVSFGLGVVDIEPSEIVNSDWALEAHLRVFFTDHIAFGLTHFSNAGSDRPNRGYNFITVELVF